MANPVPQRNSELWTHLDEQLRFLRRSCNYFDEGDTAEAKRLAVHIYTLVVHSESNKPGTAKSLLRQLRLMPGMGFIDTAKHYPKGTEFPFGDARLVTVCLTLTPNGESSGCYEALCRLPSPPPFAKPRVVLFESWWNDIVIITPEIKFSRCDLVRFLRNKFGGGHVDETISEETANLVREDPLLIEYQVNDNAPIVPQGVELHSIRQIAHEVIISIERKLKIGR